VVRRHLTLRTNKKKNATGRKRFTAEKVPYEPKSKSIKKGKIQGRKGENISTKIILRRKGVGKRLPSEGRKKKPKKSHSSGEIWKEKTKNGCKSQWVGLGVPNELPVKEKWRQIGSAIDPNAKI